MNSIDYFILIMVGIGTCIGLIRGFFKEAIGTLGLLLAAIAANFVSPYARPSLNKMIDSELVASIIVWIVVFILALILLKMIASLLTSLVKTVQLSWLNRLAGGLFAAIKYTLIIALAISLLEVVCAYVEGLRVATLLKESQLVPYVHQVVDIVTPWASQHILGPILEMLKN